MKSTAHLLLAAPAAHLEASWQKGIDRALTKDRLDAMGSAWSEGALIRYAYAFEQAPRHRRAPRLLRTLDGPAG